MKPFPLQPLRIPAGWQVLHNTFSEYDPAVDSLEYADELCEDLLQVQNHNLLIDLGWYPEGKTDGSYMLCLVDVSSECPFDSPLTICRSQSKQEIVERIECWMSDTFISQYLH